MKTKVSVFVMSILLSVMGTYYLFPLQGAERQNSFKWKILADTTISDRVPFSRLFFWDKNNGIAITSGGINRTVDGGKNWSISRDHDGKGFSSLVFDYPQIGLAVGSDEKNKPLILQTENKGTTWEEVIFKDEDSQELNGRFTIFYDICFDQPGRSWLVGDGGIVQVINNGKEWKISSIFSTEESLSSISCNGAGDVWAVGDGGTVLHYENEWLRKDLGKDAFLEKDLGNEVSFRKVKTVGDDVWIIGLSRQKLVQPNDEIDISGILLRSRDKGKSWENKTPSSADGLFDIYFEGENGWLVGRKGSIYSTKDRGNSWVKDISPTEKDLLNIFFLDTSSGWIAGDEGIILHYTK